MGKSEPTVILKNRKTGKEYPVSESEAKRALQNKNLSGTFEATKAAPIPDEIKELREKSQSEKTDQDLKQETAPAGNSTANEATKRSNAGNTKD